MPWPGIKPAALVYQDDAITNGTTWPGPDSVFGFREDKLPFGGLNITCRRVSARNLKEHNFFSRVLNIKYDSPESWDRSPLASLVGMFMYHT